MDERLPLSEAQRGVWHALRLDPAAAAYDIGGYAEIRAPVDAALLERAGAAMVAEVPAFRVRFDDSTDPVTQMVAPTMPVPLRRGAFPDPAQALAWIRAELAVPRDPTRDPLVEIALLDVGDDRHWWYVRSHHLVLDGYSVPLVCGRVASLYTSLLRGERPAPSPFGSYRRLLDAETAYRASPDFAADRAFWRARMSGAHEVPTLSGRTGPPLGPFHRASAALPPRVAAALRHRGPGRAWVPVLMAAFAGYLSRLTGAHELRLGIPMAGRSGPLLRIPGNAANLLPLRVAAPPRATPADLIAAVAAELDELRRHQRYRGEDLSRDLGAVGVGPALFGPSVNVRDFDHGLTFGPAETVLHDVTAGPVEDLTLSVRRQGTHFTLHLDGNAAAYPRTDVREHLPRFLDYLAAFSTGRTPPDHPAARRTGAHLHGPTVPADHRAGAHRDGSRARTPSWDGVAEALVARARRTPSAVALRDKDRTWTFAELSGRVGRLAGALRRAGVGPETLVALHVRRSAEHLVAMLAVAHAGGAWLSLDPEHPPGRLAQAIEDVRPALILFDDPPAPVADSTGAVGEVPDTARRNGPRAAAGRGPAPGHSVDRPSAVRNSGSPGDGRWAVRGSGPPGDELSADQGAGSSGGGWSAVLGAEAPADRSFAVRDVGAPAEPGEQRWLPLGAGIPALPVTADGETIGMVPVEPGNLAYVMRTSGSTGRPRTVAVTRAGLSNLLASHGAGIAARAPIRVAHTAPLTVDAAIDPLLWMLAGHELVLLDEETYRDPFAFVRAVRAERIDLVDVPPSYLRVLLDAGLLDAGAHRPSIVVFGGEASPAELWERLRSVPLALNAYGPTESTVDALIAEVGAAPVPVLGTPVAGSRALVLDAALRPVPEGGVGELYLGGPGIARGYAGQPALTATRFVADPLGPPGARLFRTGDLVRVRFGGALEFLGRADDQVKIRGFRVEPREVETVLSAHPGIRACAVVPRPSPAGPVLVAYVVPNAPVPADPHAPGGRRPGAPPADVRVPDDLPPAVTPDESGAFGGSRPAVARDGLGAFGGSRPAVARDGLGAFGGSRPAVARDGLGAFGGSRPAATPGDLRMVTGSPGALTPADLLVYARTALPDHLVPAAFVLLPELPLAEDGTLDRRALPEPRLGGGPAYRAPRTPVEEVLCASFAEVLEVERVGADDDFFALGGHSLLAARLLGVVRARIGAEIALRAVFTHRTPAALARTL